jgi:hypothetical protein
LTLFAGGRWRGGGGNDRWVGWCGGHWIATGVGQVLGLAIAQGALPKAIALVVVISNSVYIWKNNEIALIQSYTLMEGAVKVNRKMNPKSLENLKMGAIARNQGKVRCQVTIRPETKEWLARGGNLSGRIDELVAKVLKGELVGVCKLEQMQQEVKRLEAEVERSRSI